MITNRRSTEALHKSTVNTSLFRTPLLRYWTIAKSHPAPLAVACQTAVGMTASYVVKQALAQIASTTDIDYTSAGLANSTIWIVCSLHLGNRHP